LKQGVDLRLKPDDPLLCQYHPKASTPTNPPPPFTSPHPAAICPQRNQRQSGSQSFTFGQIREQAARFANVLAAHGVGAGDIVSGMRPCIPELLITIMGTWRAGAIYQPLFTALGPKAIEMGDDPSPISMGIAPDF